MHSTRGKEAIVLIQDIRVETSHLHPTSQVLGMFCTLYPGVFAYGWVGLWPRAEASTS